MNRPKWIGVLALVRRAGGPGSRRLRAAGASAYAQIGAARSLADAVREEAGRGLTHCTSTATGRPAVQPATRLTARQREILGLVVKGLANGEVAQSLSLSESTVRYHLSRLYAQFGFRSRAEAVAWALRKGLI